MSVVKRDPAADLQNGLFAGSWEKVKLEGDEEGVRVTRKLDDRCRVTLPADICEFLDLQPGDFVELVIKKKNKPRP